MTNKINLMGFDQSTSFTGIFAGTFELDDPYRAPTILDWRSIGKERGSKAKPFESCTEFKQYFKYEAVYRIDAYACEDGFFDKRFPSVGAQIKMSPGWLDAMVAYIYGMPVHHVEPAEWRTIWGPHKLSGAKQFKKHSIMLAEANLKNRWDFEKSPINDHMADAYWITAWLFREIVEGRIQI